MQGGKRGHPEMAASENVMNVYAESDALRLAELMRIIGQLEWFDR